jgi:hypothetical protein
MPPGGCTRNGPALLARAAAGLRSPGGGSSSVRRPIAVWPTSDSGRAELPPTLLTRNRRRVALCPATSEVGKSRSLTGASTPDVAGARRMPFDKVRRAFAFSQPRDPRPRPASDSGAGRTRVCGLASSSAAPYADLGAGHWTWTLGHDRPDQWSMTWATARRSKASCATSLVDPSTRDALL